MSSMEKNVALHVSTYRRVSPLTCMAAFYDINGRMLCELLSSDKYNNSDKFINSHLFHHFSIRVSSEWYLCKSSLTIFTK